MKKRWVALLLLSGCIAWPTTSENLPSPEDGSTGGTSDGGSVTGDGPVTSVCPGDGVVVRSMKELQEQLADLSTRLTDGTEHVFCIEPAGMPYSLSTPVTVDRPTLGSIYFAPISNKVTLLGLGRDPADTVIAGANASGQQPTVGAPRCPVGSARFFFVTDKGHLTLANLTLQGGCIQGARGGDSYNGAGGGGGSAGFGGAVAVQGGKLTLDRAAFKNNIAIGGLGGSCKTAITTPPFGGGGGAGLDALGRTPSADGSEAPVPGAKYDGGNGGGIDRGAGGTTSDGGAGGGSSGGGGGAGATGADTVRAGSGGGGGTLGGGGGGGGATYASSNPIGGSGGPFGLCGGGGGSGLGKSTMTMMISTGAGGGGAGYGPLLGIPQGQIPSPVCGDPGEASTGTNGGFGGSGWGAGGAIFFAGGTLTIKQIDPAAQTGNAALVPTKNQIKGGLGPFLFTVGSDGMSAGVVPFTVIAPATANIMSGVMRLTCSMGACTYQTGM